MGAAQILQCLPEEDPQKKFLNNILCVAKDPEGGLNSMIRLAGEASTNSQLVDLNLQNLNQVSGQCYAAKWLSEGINFDTDLIQASENREFQDYPQ